MKQTVSLREAVARSAGQIQHLKEKIAGLRDSGKQPAWIRKEIQNAAKDTFNRLQPLKTEMKLHALSQKAAARQKETSTDWPARQYYLQLAGQLAEGRSAEGLNELYKEVLSDPELGQFKGEFERVIESKLPEAEQAEFLSLKRRHMTPLEEQQEREKIGAEAWEAHVETISGFLDLALEELEKNGHTAIDVQNIFDEMQQNINKQKSSTIEPERRPENQEQMRQMQESLQKSRVTSL